MESVVDLASSVRDRLRGMLGIRKTRRVPPKRNRPPTVGARAFKEDLRMTVQAGMTYELWRWLQDQGWREASFRPDRRSYFDVPSHWVMQLTDAAAEERGQVLSAAIQAARARGPTRAHR